MGLTQKVLDNKRRQHAYVLAHKRRIRDEVNPRLRATKRAWWEASCRNKRMIDLKWRTKSCEVRLMQKEQQRKHRETINAHKRRIRAEVAKRRREH